MRKIFSFLLAVFMLAATLAAFPISAEEAPVTKSNKDGSTAADAQEIDLVITEVAANTKSIYHGNNNFTGDAFQYIEIYNRGTVAVDLYDYAIVQANYSITKAQPWDNGTPKFQKKVPIDSGSIYAAFDDPSIASVMAGYKTSVANNPVEATIEPGEFAVIWFWNQYTKTASDANNYDFGKSTDDGASFERFRNYYKDSIAEDTLVVAVLGTADIAASFQLNTTGNYMYGLVKDTGEGFDMTEPIYTKVPAGNDFEYTRNEDVICMFEHGAGLGYNTAYENKSVIYTTADNTPYYHNAYYSATLPNYVEINNDRCEGFKELGCIWYKEDPTPGSMPAIQWADLDPDRAPASVKGTDANWGKTAWDTYTAALVAANMGTEVPSRPEEDLGQSRPEEDLGQSRPEVDLGQSNINVDRDNLGNLNQNVFGAWNYFSETEGGVTNYYRYQNDGYHTEDDRVQVPKDEYDMATHSPLTAGGYTYYTAGGKYYKYNAAATVATAVEIPADECIQVLRETLGDLDENGRTEGKDSQDEINVDRNNLPNLGANTIDAWAYFSETVDGVTKYYRYRNDGQHDESDAVEISKEDYDIAMAALAESNTDTNTNTNAGTNADANTGTNTGTSTPAIQAVQSTVNGDYVYCLANDGKYYKHNVGGSLESAVEIDETEYSQAIAPPPVQEEPESGSGISLLIVGAVVGALIIVGIGAAILINFAKNKSDLAEEELSADEDDGFPTKKKKK